MSIHWMQISGSKFIVATSSNRIADCYSDMSKTAKYWPLQTKSVHVADVFGFDHFLVPSPLIPKSCDLGNPLCFVFSGGVPLDAQMGGVWPVRSPKA